ncbi:MAG: hypothetical protein AAGB51_12060 [Planctomycetota bacterium]
MGRDPDSTHFAPKWRRTALLAAGGVLLLTAAAAAVPTGMGPQRASASSNAGFVGELIADRALLRVYAGPGGDRFEYCDPDSGRPMSEPMSRPQLFAEHPHLRLEQFRVRSECDASDAGLTGSLLSGR